MIDIEAAFVEHFSYVYLYIRKLSHNEAIAEEITSVWVAPASKAAMAVS